MPDTQLNTSVAHVVGLAAMLVGVWIAWSGHFEPLLLAFGAGSVFLTIWMSHRMKVIDDEGQPLNHRLLFYAPWLLMEIVKANIDVISRILKPSLPITPTWILVEATQKTQLGRVVFANSITLTPGTVSIEVGENSILVHALSVEGASSLLNGGGEMGQKVCSVES